MRLFLRHVSLQLIPEWKGEEPSPYRTIDNEEFSIENLSGKCLLPDTTADQLKNILSWIEQNRLPDLNELICLSPKVEDLKKLVKAEFRIIKAAGGLVTKGDQYLLIHRLGKWDLPKGKLEKGEKMKEAAVREVEEECNIRVKRGEKICNTWHSYNQEGKRILKKTAWYSMSCEDDRKMKPQKEEDIDDIRWFLEHEAIQLLSESYPSIRTVFNLRPKQQRAGEASMEEME